MKEILVHEVRCLKHGKVWCVINSPSSVEEERIIVYIILEIGLGFGTPRGIPCV
ncbi:hypothetical protein RND71_006290 [Anisodus tanguticus]|uniref:Uncharacterized protein n=1 Tax=Anisodus tanguticus TaxID=243964 RepID=A0AAE1SQK5_9SOLA|nr:hypothetical protein RND71_006290 [Anisodus tanguticus]